MINFEAIIRCFWERAVQDVKRDFDDHDREALDALDKKDAQNRTDSVRRWLQAYRVFRVRGIAAQKDLIADAVLKWADPRDHERNLGSPSELDAAHRELMEPICKAYLCNSQNQPREFTSLTSKALWLCYPEKVPMFDSYAQRALWVLAKLEFGIAAPSSGSDYFQFVSVWKQLYEIYLPTLSNLNAEGYPYPVRVFDRILWLIGKDQYTI
jgi:hypothetical protein